MLPEWPPEGPWLLSSRVISTFAITSHQYTITLYTPGHLQISWDVFAKKFVDILSFRISFITISNLYRTCTMITHGLYFYLSPVYLIEYSNSLSFRANICNMYLSRVSNQEQVMIFAEGGNHSRTGFLADCCRKVQSGSSSCEMEIFHFLWLIWDHYIPLAPT